MSSGAIEYASLGDSAIEVSRLCLGGNNFGWRLDRAETRAIVDAAIETGINFFDTADMYGLNAPGLPPPGHSARGDSERLLGEALAGRRDSVVLATKFGNDMGDGEPARGAPDYVRRAVDASLQRLGTDYIDLLYYHEPDGITPLEETIGAMSELLAAGKIRALGCSNLGEAQLRAVGRRICALQNRCNLLDQRDVPGLIEACVELDVAYVPYSPLADGVLSGKYRRGEPIPPGARRAQRPPSHAVLDRVEALAELAAACGHSLLELAIGWLCALPGIASVIVGVTGAAQVRDNVAATKLSLTAEELQAIADCSQATLASSAGGA
jgi:aryl-alcohol dehydrogenase-like predicted oxidoreductase